MPICPSCRSEYRAGFSRCADCDVDLVDTLAAAPPPAPAPDEWSPIFVGDTATAEILRGTLEAAGIKTITPDQNNAQIGGNAFSTRVFRLLVATKDLARAQEIVRGDPDVQVSGDEEQLLRFPCLCGQTLEVPVQSAGQELDCPYCNRTVMAPEIPRERVPGSADASANPVGRGFCVVSLPGPDGVTLHYGTLLPPQHITVDDPLGDDVIFGSFKFKPGEVPTAFLPDVFLPNPRFAEVLHGFLADFCPRQPGFGAEAAQGGATGWVYIIDQRTADPAGNVPIEDIVGGFEFRSGTVAGYKPNVNHILYTRRGLFDLGQSLNTAFLKHLSALHEKRRRP